MAISCLFLFGGHIRSATKVHSIIKNSQTSHYVYKTILLDRFLPQQGQQERYASNRPPLNSRKKGIVERFKENWGGSGGLLVASKNTLGTFLAFPGIFHSCTSMRIALVVDMVRIFRLSRHIQLYTTHRL